MFLVIQNEPGLGNSSGELRDQVGSRIESPWDLVNLLVEWINNPGFGSPWIRGHSLVTYRNLGE